MKKWIKIAAVTAVAAMILYNLTGGVSLQGTGWLAFDVFLLVYIVMRA